MRISVIGAGPAGCIAAKDLAEAGHEVVIFEEHKSIGLPVQCTGLVTSSLSEIIDIPKKAIKLRIKKARIYSPEKRFIAINFKKPNLILDRAILDKLLAAEAKVAGAKIILGKRVTGINASKTEIFVEGKGKVRSDAIIAANGPVPLIGEKPKYWLGLQAIVERQNDLCIDFFPWIGAFAWSVPESRTRMRVGVCSLRNTKQHLSNLIKMLGIKKVIEIQGGLIPLYEKKKTYFKNNIYLLGDAACQVKATTGGGLVPGIRAAKILAMCISKDLDYEKVWRKEIGMDLLAHRIARRALDNMKRKDYVGLIRRFSSPGLRKALERIDRDDPLNLAIMLLKNDPMLIVYSRFLI